MPRGFSTLAPLFWQARFSTLYGNHGRLCFPAPPSLSICSNLTPRRFFEPNHKPPLLSIFATLIAPRKSLPAPSFLSPIPFPRTPFTPLHLLPSPSNIFPSQPLKQNSLLQRIPNPIQETILFLIIYPLLPIINLIYQYLLIFISKY